MLFAFRAIAAFFFLVATCSHDAGAIDETRDVEEHGAAKRYFDNISDSEDIYTWPSRLIFYEILENQSKAHEAFQKYARARSSVYWFFPAINHAQVSIVFFNGKKENLSDLISKSNLLPSYKDFVVKAKRSHDGCTAFKFLSRRTWVAVGVVIADEEIIQRDERVTLNECVSRGLDYINGIPTADGPFSYLDFPNLNARLVLMLAIEQCVKLDNNPKHADEITRSGITPLPSIKCIRSKIYQ